MYKVLLLGSGAREHAIASKLSQSKNVGKIFVAPGNGGTKNEGSKISNLDTLNIEDNKEIINWCLKNNPNLIVVGPEDPLNNGIIDLLLEHKFNVFGPTKLAAQIECDKSFAKDFMIRHNISTAEYKVFMNQSDALEFLNNPTFENPFVVKATGLAGGKGVIVSDSIENTKKAVIDLFSKKKFKHPCNSVIIEEYLEGDEFSVLAFTDGKNLQLLPIAQDHKRAYDNDEGPNTGGMGVISPFPLIDDKQLEKIKVEILQKTIDGLNKEGAKFSGVLYAGLMLCKNNSINVLEFNCRFGDPEAQTILPLVDIDLFEILISCSKAYNLKNELTQSIPNLDKFKLKTKNANAISIVIASEGYPEKSIKHQLIEGIEKVKDKYPLEGYHIYHGATYLDNGKFYTNGGRILTIVKIYNDEFKNLNKDILNVIRDIIKIEKSFYRKDIGMKTILKLKSKCSI